MERLEVDAKNAYNISENIGHQQTATVNQIKKAYQGQRFKMWLIIISLALINYYSFLYSWVLYYSPGNCSYFYPGNVRVYNFFSVTNRMIVYCLWTMPIIYVFWPPNRTWYGTIKSERRGSQASRDYSKQTKLLSED